MPWKYMKIIIFHTTLTRTLRMNGKRTLFLLDNAPNYLVGCVIQKRMYLFTVYKLVTGSSSILCWSCMYCITLCFLTNLARLHWILFSFLCATTGTTIGEGFEAWVGTNGDGESSKSVSSSSSPKIHSVVMDCLWHNSS